MSQSTDYSVSFTDRLTSKHKKHRNKFSQINVLLTLIFNVFFSDWFSFLTGPNLIGKVAEFQSSYQIYQCWSAWIYTTSKTSCVLCVYLAASSVTSNWTASIGRYGLQNCHTAGCVHYFVVNVKLACSLYSGFL